MEDAREHPPVRNGYAVRELGVAAFIGVPLVSAAGQVLGCLGVAARLPREWTERDILVLTDLGASVVTEIELCAQSAEHRWTAALAAGQQRIAEVVAAGRRLPDVLDAIARLVEAQASGTLCSILLLDDDGQHLRHGAAPSLPAAFTRVLDGIAVGPAVVACGTAAYYGVPVVTEDIATDAGWAPGAEVALAHSLRATGLAEAFVWVWAEYAAPFADPVTSLRAW